MNSNGKVAIVLVLEEIEGERTSDTNLVDYEGNESAHLLLKALLDDHSRFLKVLLRHTDSISSIRIHSHEKSFTYIAS